MFSKDRWSPSVLSMRLHSLFTFVTLLILLPAKDFGWVPQLRVPNQVHQMEVFQQDPGLPEPCQVAGGA